MSNEAPFPYKMKQFQMQREQHKVLIKKKHHLLIAIDYLLGAVLTHFIDIISPQF